MGLVNQERGVYACEVRDGVGGVNQYGGNDGGYKEGWGLYIGDVGLTKSVVTNDGVWVKR